MKYLLALLILTACSPSIDSDIPPELPTNGSETPQIPELPAPTDGSTTVEPGYGQVVNDTDVRPDIGTHIICENDRCYRNDGCPVGYDEYMAQVGPACVRHYGSEEIAQWETCSRSSSDCECVYASKDTAGNPVPSVLRCAPSEYRNYMVHSGLSGVDKWGNGYTMIA
jgi:hypothetical protein